jgi:hypothetical protein
MTWSKGNIKMVKWYLANKDLLLGNDLDPSDTVENIICFSVLRVFNQLGVNCAL